MGLTNSDHNLYLTNKKVAKKTERTVKQITLTTDWAGEAAPYTQTLSVSEIKETSTPLIALICSSDTATARTEQEAWSFVSYAITANGTITFTCLEEKPEVALNLSVLLIE